MGVAQKSPRGGPLRVVRVLGYGCNARSTDDLRDAHKHFLEGVVVGFGRAETYYSRVQRIGYADMAREYNQSGGTPGGTQRKYM